MSKQFIWLAVVFAAAGCKKPPVVAAPDAAAAVDVSLPPSPPVADVAALPPEISASTVTPEQLLTGRATFAAMCALCHGPNGEGYAADNAPSLVSKTFLETASDVFLRTSITRGRPGTAMAGYGADIGGPLVPQQVDGIIALLRSRNIQRVAVDNHPAQGDAKAGERLYNDKCATCHGTPAQRLNAVHLFNPALLSSADDGFLRYAVLNGRPGTKMDPWQGKLTVAEIDNIITYLRLAAPPLTPPVPWMPPARPADLPPQPTPSADPAVPAGMPETPKPAGPIVINPKGKAPNFTLRDDRFAPIDEVKKALDEKRRIIIVDARAPSDYAMLHITGSIVTPYYDKKSLDVVPNDGTWVIAYCACPHHASGEVADELKRRGYKHVAVLDEGVFAWKSKGYPVVESAAAANFAAPPPMPAQAPAMPLAATPAGR